MRRYRQGPAAFVALPLRGAQGDALRGRRPDESAARDAATAALRGAVTRGDNDFKPELARRTVTRAILACAGLEN